MSRSLNYSKWDNLDTDSDTEDNTSTNRTILNTTTPPPAADSDFTAQQQEDEVANLSPSAYAHMTGHDHAAVALNSPIDAPPPAAMEAAAKGVSSRPPSAPSSSPSSSAADAPTTSPAGIGEAPVQPKGQMKKKSPTSSRFVYLYGDRPVYEWEQNLDEVNLYLHPPPQVPAQYIQVKLKPHSLSVGLEGSTTGPFIDERTGGLVDVKASTWTIGEVELDGGKPGEKVRELNIVLAKGHRGEMWEMPLRGKGGGDDDEAGPFGGGLDPMLKNEVAKQMMLERFQEENPGFDFRNAEFNGAVPSARDFMGGVKYN